MSAADSKRARFESTVSPHLDAAYNLARWLTGNDDDAEDVVQEAMLRAFTYFDGFRGGDARSWVLKIIRNTCFTWLQANRPSETSAMGGKSWRSSPHRFFIRDLLRILRRWRFVGRPLFSSMMRSPRYQRRFVKSWFYVRWRDFPTRKLPLSLPHRWAP